VSPDQFRELADLLPEPMLLVSGDCCILAVNRVLARELNRKPEELQSKDLAEICACSSDEVQNYIRASSRTREPLIGALTLVCSDGERKAYRSTGAVVQPKSNILPAVVVLRLIGKAQAVGSFMLLNQQVDELTREIAARKWFEMRHYTFMRDMLFSVTEGKLLLCHSVEDLPVQLKQIGVIPITVAHDIYHLRQLALSTARSLGFSKEKCHDLVTSVGEAAMNAFVHGRRGSGTVCVSEDGALQVWIEDEGGGIAIENLPRATLQKGYTTAGTLGHGFKFMLQTVERAWLYTNEKGTIVVISQTET